MSKRNLYLSNKRVDKALESFLAAVRPCLAAADEKVKVIESLDRVTAAAVYARCNSPLYDSAAMDGIAVISVNTHGARETNPVDLRQGTDFMVVDTGDPIRPPYDSVIMAEELEEVDESTLRIRAAASPWQHVRPIGEDIVKGEMIIPSGHVIRPIDIGVLLSGGITEIQVKKRPRVAIIPTGTELLEPGEQLTDDGIIESNSRVFEAMVTQGGGIPSRFTPVPDDYGLLREIISDAVNNHDMVLVNAGSSAGTEDYTVHVLRELGQVVVHGVAMKPGKPVILAVVKDKPVIGVPGYPVSAYLAYENFAAPVLELLSGNVTNKRQTVKATLTRRLVSSLKHREYVRVKVGRVEGKLVAAPLARGAGAAMSLVRADGFCIIEQDLEGIGAGREVDIILTNSLSEIDSTVVSIGSHDLILDVIADMLPGLYPGMNLSSTHVGSLGGLLALTNGEAHIAPTHILDEQTGEYNSAAIKQLFYSEPMALIKGVGRMQGIITAKGNPKRINSIADLTGCRYINRQRGAGTRILLDYKLEREGICPSDIQGYDREAATHMAVAAAIKSGSAEAGMGILSAAKAMDLDFVFVSNEEYDFAIPQRFLTLPHVKAFISVLRNERFLERLDKLGGYTWDRCGEVLLIDR